MKALNIIFFLFIFISLTLNQSCPEHCICDKVEEEEEVCIECEQGYYNIDNLCRDACNNCPNQQCDKKSGICTEQNEDCIGQTTYNIYCNEPCTDKVSGCAKCHRKGDCFECSDNHYWGPQCSSQCTVCPESTCNFDGTCNKDAEFCNDPTVYGDSCTTLCTNNNRQYCAKCRKTGGVCTECSGSHYGDNCDGDCSKCPQGKCDMNGVCTQTADACDDPHYTGNMCNNACSSVHPNCDKCLMSNGDCTECKESFYNTNCEGSCINCPGGTCLMTGICTDKSSNCEGETMKGDYCNTPCTDDGHTNCEKCNRNGICSKCTDNKYKGDYCTDLCSNCPGGTCHSNGTCIDQSNNCADETMKGEKCETPCSDDGHTNCEKCNRNGICSKCKDNKYKGDYCEVSCENCPGGLCSPDGTCSDTTSNCDNNLFYGPKCDKPCNETNEFCETCDRNGKCLSCKGKLKYGSDCSQPCENCPGEICEFNGGTCINEGDCKNLEYYEDKCQLPCSNISDFCDTCHRNGICVTCTDESHYGNDCKGICDRCPTPSCEISGICKDKSSNCFNNSYYGDSCEYECKDYSTYCSKCNRNKTCFECSDRHYYGNKCEDMCKTCPGELCNNIGICDNTKDNCKDDDFYGPDCKTECTKIGENCLKCNRNETCSVCVNSTMYGPKCEQYCENCPNNQCNIDGSCVNPNDKCIDDHYFGIDCQKPCTDINGTCDTCTRDGICTSCKTPEYWGEYCENHCDNCPENKCHFNGTCVDQTSNCIGDIFTGEKCDEPCTDINRNCLYCNRQRACFECKNRTMFGDECSIPCNNCPGEESLCNNKGICDDKNSPCRDPSFTGANCSVLCKKKYDNCQECDRENICTLCENEEFYGEKCETPCDNCPGEHGLCYIDGICKDNITDCDNKLYTGNNCSVLCQNLYPMKNCKTCHRNGTCITCVNEEFYGEKCESSCENCPGEDGTCDINGICKDKTSNCDNDSYTGDTCWDLCKDLYPMGNCKTCDRNGTCLSCINEEFYGEKCETPCQNCPGEDGTCDINGICHDNSTDCDNISYTGNNCSILCKDLYPMRNCKTCHRNNTCISCFNETFYGKDCESSCENCPGKEGTCDINGICKDKIENCDNDSYTGETCWELCEDLYPMRNCKTCNRNKTCISCFNETFYGDNCEESCANCPGEGTCDINGICEDQTTKCDNDSYTGANCSILCSDIHENCLRCDRNYTCIECIDRTKFGKTCEDECDKCPGDKPGERGLCNINGTCDNDNAPCFNDSFTGADCSVLCNYTYPNCKTCDRKNKCFTCFDELKYGDDCNQSCFNCPSGGECDINGDCKDQIEDCVNNSYTGANCSKFCYFLYPKKNCETCHRNNKCISCFDEEYYGDTCEDSCFNCPSECYNNGICKDNTTNCKNNSFTGPKCTDKCWNLVPNCKSCTRNNTCFECINRTFYGFECDIPCPYCPGNGLCQNDGRCDNQDSKCSDDTYTGEKCDKKCSEEVKNCLTCNRDNICTECINRTSYGIKCDIPCGYCPGEGLCLLNGTCDDQISNCANDSYTGPFCNQTCSSLHENCKRCDRNGKCLECIDEKFYGDTCNQSCANCPGFCHINGSCVNSTELCIDSKFTGDKCDDPCVGINDNCFRCDRNYSCIECGNKKMYGNYCNKSCDKCPDECHIDGVCNDTQTPCLIDTYTGEKCDELCIDKINKNCKRCSRKLECIECIDKRYHGVNCTEGCPYCSETGCNVQGYCSEFKCQNSTYGLGCTTHCTCDSNSDNSDCGKFGGQCLNCKFGYFGKSCEESCYYKCQTELCCILKSSKNKIESKLNIKTNYRYIDIEVGGIKKKFLIDYNYGYPLTLFNTKTQTPECDTSMFDKIDYSREVQRGTYLQNFTNFLINSTLYNNETIKINGITVKNVDLTIANSVECRINESYSYNISGVIGLGFFNAISNSYFSKNISDIHKLNILSYFYDGKEVELNFGNMFKEQIDYVERLTSCDVILDSESDIQGKKMTCRLEGIKNAKYSEAFELKNAFITFSLGEKSSLILGNNENYAKYLEEIYFKKGDFEIIDNKESNEANDIKVRPNKYYLYKGDKINKLPNFGFVFNDFYYSYSPDKFFQDDASGKKRFLIEVNKNSNKTEFIIGKEFLEDIKFTINNEEAKIYFYAKNAEFCNKFTNEVNSKTFGIKLDARESAAVSLSIIIFINLVAFSIYYCIKRRNKIDSNEYSKLI